MAMAGKTLLIVDAGRLNAPCDIQQPLNKVDAFTEREIVVAGKDFAALLRDGKTAWRIEGPVNDIAVINDRLAIAGTSLRLFDKQGKQLFHAPFVLNALAAEGKWLIGSDSQNFRILRLELKY